MYHTNPSSTSIILFFFNDTATTEIYTLSLHDALPISSGRPNENPRYVSKAQASPSTTLCLGSVRDLCFCVKMRSEEHTSELQSRLHLVCRLLLEKKKTKTISRTTRTLSM